MSSPIEVSSGDCSLTPISVSSDSSPIQFPGAVPLPRALSVSSDLSPIQISRRVPPPQAPRFISQVTDRSIFLGSPTPASRLVSPALSSRVSGLLPAHVPRPALSTHSALSRSIAPAQYQDVDLELAQLREQCEALQTENAELKGRVEALKYIFN